MDKWIVKLFFMFLFLFFILLQQVESKEHSGHHCTTFDSNYISVTEYLMLHPDSWIFPESFRRL